MMERIEIREACVVSGEPREVGEKIAVDSSTAKILITMGRAALATEESAPEEKPVAPRARAKANDPQPAPQED